MDNVYIFCKRTNLNANILSFDELAKKIVRAFGLGTLKVDWNDSLVLSVGS